MRKLFLAGLVVAALSGLASAQTGRAASDELIRYAQTTVAEINKLPKTCVDVAGVTRQLDETTALDGFEFRCVRTFGDGLKLKGADWVMVGPKK